MARMSARMRTVRRGPVFLGLPVFRRINARRGGRRAFRIAIATPFAALVSLVGAAAVAEPESPSPGIRTVPTVSAPAVKPPMDDGALAASSGSARRGDSPSERLIWPPRAKSDVYIDRFIDVAGGWWLELKCGHLDSDRHDRFEWHVSTIAGELQDRGLMRDVAMVQGAARSVAARTVCDLQSIRTVTTGEMASPALLTILGHAPFDRTQSLIDRRRTQMIRIASALGLMDRCGFGDQDSRAVFATVFDTLVAHYGSVWRDAALPTRLDGIRLEAARATQPACGPTLEAIASQMMLLALRLGLREQVWTTGGSEAVAAAIAGPVR